MWRCGSVKFCIRYQLDCFNWNVKIVIGTKCGAWEFIQIVIGTKYGGWEFIRSNHTDGAMVAHETRQCSCIPYQKNFWSHFILFIGLLTIALHTYGCVLQWWSVQCGGGQLHWCWAIIKSPNSNTYMQFNGFVNVSYDAC